MTKFTGVAGKMFAYEKIQALKNKIKEVENAIEKDSLVIIKEWRDKGEFYIPYFGTKNVTDQSDTALLRYAKDYLFSTDWYSNTNLKSYKELLDVMRVNFDADEYTLTREDAVLLGTLQQTEK